MAENQNVNKVVYGDDTVMDITDTTAEAADVAAGEVFYKADGSRAVGIGDYMSKVASPTAGDVLTTDANGQAVDSGVQVSELDEVFVAVYGTTTYSELADAVDAGKVIAVQDSTTNFNYFICSSVRSLSSTIYLSAVYYVETVSKKVLMYDYELGSSNSWSRIERTVQVSQATNAISGTIKLNPAEFITLNENGQIVVGGRLGQFPDGGLYYPTSADPVAVGNYTLLMSEAKGLSTAHRELIIAGGSTVALKTAAAAGATQYRISNTQTNRFLCLAWVDGRLAVDEAGAKEKTVAITSVKFANGNNISAYFGATESSNDIIITVAETLNPSDTLSSVRGYGTWKNADIVSAGQGNYVGGGKVLQVGQANVSANGKNQIGMIGIRQYCEGASSFLVGADNINKKAFSALFGQGIDNTGGIEGGAYFGKWPIVSADTAFVVGNGTAYNAKSNLFEIKTNGDVYVNGVKKISG